MGTKKDQSGNQAELENSKARPTAEIKQAAQKLPVLSQQPKPSADSGCDTNNDSDDEDSDEGSDDGSDYDEFELSHIIGKKVQDGVLYYKCMWVGFGEDDWTWEPEAHLENSSRLVADFEAGKSAAGTKRAVSSISVGGCNVQEDPAQEGVPDWLVDGCEHVGKKVRREVQSRVLKGQVTKYAFSSERGQKRVPVVFHVEYDEVPGILNVVQQEDLNLAELRAAVALSSQMEASERRTKRSKR